MLKFRILKLIPMLIKVSEPEIKKIILIFEEGDQSEFLIMEHELERFLTATIKLHFNPGKNPHNKKHTSRLVSIRIADLISTGPYWWSTPNLKDNDDKRGARIWRWGESKEIWKEGKFLIPS